MAVCRRSPRFHFGQPMHAGQIHIDNSTPYSKITANNSGSACTDAPGLRYNENTGTWQFSNDGLNYFNMGSGTGGSGSTEFTTKLTEVVTSQIIAESTHTIPGGESYTLDTGNNLDVYFNGQLLTHDKGTNTIDYTENTTTTIKFHFNVPAGSILQYMIRK